MSVERLTQKAKDIFNGAEVVNGNKVKVGDLLDGIKKASGIGEKILERLPRTRIKKTQLVAIEDVVLEAFNQSLKLQHVYVGSEHILLAILKNSSPKNYAKALELIKELNIFPQERRFLDKKPNTPILDTYGANVTKIYNIFEKDTVLPSPKAFNLLMSALLQQKNYNALIVGEPGVGKRSLIELLSKSINNLDVPPLLAGYRVVEFDLMAFVASMVNKGGTDAGLTAFFDELTSLGRSIVYLKNFQNIFMSTNSGVSVPFIYSILKAGLESNNIRIVATMNASLFEKIIVDNEHVFENFTIIPMEEPGVIRTMSILEAKAANFEQFHNIKIDKEILSYVHKRALERLKDAKFPEKAVNLLDKACTRLILDKSVVPDKYKEMVDHSITLEKDIRSYLDKGEFKKAAKLREEYNSLDKKLLIKEKNMFSGKILVLTREYVDKALADMHVTLSAEEEVLDTETVRNLSKQLKARIAGQDEAIDVVTKALIRSKLGLRSKKRPIGNFLFLGPTGVGKTELAKVLAQNAFGNHGLIRLDMSDFGEKHTVARLIGAPPGYVGYGEGGELTSKIESKPDSVVLFDEIEKAHTDVLNILLQIMEEGELSDARGTTFDFSRAVIILTSNLGTEILHNTSIGFDDSNVPDGQVEKRLKNNLKRILKPELLNRFDEIIVFSRLKKKDQLRVLQILINDIIETLNDQNIHLRIGIKTKRHLLQIGYSDEYGARSLRRILEKELLDRVAEYLLNNKQRPLKISAELIEGKILIKN